MMHTRQKALCILLAVTLGAWVALVVGIAPVVAADDYPADYRAPNKDLMPDQWGFWNRECTSFAAWRMQRDGHAMSNLMVGPNGKSGQFGDANTWYANALHIGIPTSSAPSMGTIEQSAAVGHVAYVENASTSPPTVEDYNRYLDGRWQRWNWGASDAKYLNFGPPSASDFLVNGNFEGSTTGWSAWGSASINIDPSPVKPRSGSNYLDMWVSFSDGSGVKQSVVATPQVGQSYYLSVWVRSEVHGFPVTGKVVLWGTPIHDPYDNGSTIFTTTDSWQLVVVSYYVNYSGKSGFDADIYLDTTGSNDVLNLDAASLGYSWLINPNLIGTPSQTPYGWLGWGSGSVVVDPNPVQPRVGQSYADMTVTANDGSGVKQSICVVPEQGRTYYLSAWVRSADSTTFDGTLALWGTGGTLENGSTTFHADNSAWKLVIAGFYVNYAGHGGMDADFYLTTTSPHRLNVDGVMVSSSLLTNANFNGGTGMPYGWRSWGSGHLQMDPNASQHTPRIDQYYADAWVTASDGSGVGQSLAAHTVSPQTGQTYWLLVWIRSDPADGTPVSGYVQLWGTPVGSPPYDNSQTTFISTSNWTLVIVGFYVNQAGHTGLDADIYIATPNHTLDLGGATLIGCTWSD